MNYFTAAGNDNLLNEEEDNIASWEAPAFRPTACPAGLPSYEQSCMDFNPASGSGAGEEDPTLGVTVGGVPLPRQAPPLTAPV